MSDDRDELDPGARGRTILFFIGVVPLIGLLAAAMVQLPRSGAGHSLYGDLLVGAAVRERHVTDVVTAINFDYRGFDTLGEELILFASVMGVLLILRKSDEQPACDDREDERQTRRAPPTSEAVRALGLGMIGVTLTFGLYIITHGQLTPGGGFQGGVIVATAWVLLYLAGDARAYERATPKPVVEGFEAIGAVAYALLGFAGLLAGLSFLANLLPLGPIATAHSGGTIALLSVATGLEVAGGFVLLVTSFVEEALAERAGSS